MKFVVTGANGFIGRAITQELARRGHQVCAAARHEINNLPAGAEWREAPDLGADADWSLVVKDADIVIHCAARVHVMEEQESDPLTAFRAANRDGTLALAQAAERAGTKRLVFLSSIKVNGESTAPGQSFSPNDEPAPTDPYGVSKAEAETELRRFAGESALEIVIIRPVLVYGPGVKANFAALLHAVKRGMPLPLGSIHNRRSLVYLGNLVDLAVCTATHPTANGQTFIASDGEDLSTTQLLHRIGKAVGKPARLLPCSAAIIRLTAAIIGRGAAARRLTESLAVDNSAAQRKLGWEPPFTVDSGLAETALKEGSIHSS